MKILLVFILLVINSCATRSPQSIDIAPNSKDYVFSPNMTYSYCEEKILEHLSQNLKIPTRIERILQINDPYFHILRVKLATCKKSIEYRFNYGTTAVTCENASENKNLLLSVSIPNVCENNFAK